jgi:hypothetical protein
VTTPISPAELESSLAQFSGTECHHKLALAPLKFTDGMAYLCQNAGGGAFWLASVIASYQHKLRKTERLREFQHWTLTTDLEKHTAVIQCREDSGEPPVVTQNIEYTDFPLASIEIWVEGDVCLLPSEH